MLCMIHSSYYRALKMGKKGNIPSKFNFHKDKEWTDQNSVI